MTEQVLDHAQVGSVLEKGGWRRHGAERAG